MNYYIIENGQQVGPLSIDQLSSHNITGETPVWHEGMGQWGKAKDIPELNSIANGTTPPPYTPNSQQAPSTPQPPKYDHKKPQPSQPCPDNHLAISIIATIATLTCCSPFPIGIVALVYSLNVENKWKGGDYDKAIQYAKNAKNWAIGSIIVALAVSMICILLYIIFGVVFFESLYDIYYTRL